MISHYEVYQDSAKEWRWRLKANNGRTVADSGEGYFDKRGCLEAIELIETGFGCEIRSAGTILGGDILRKDNRKLSGTIGSLFGLPKM